MLSLNRKTLIVVLIFLFAVASSLFVAVKIYKNRVPKSAKLVLYLENKDSLIGENKIVTINEEGTLR